MNDFGLKPAFSVLLSSVLSQTGAMVASAHYESIKPYLRKPPFSSQPEKSHIYLADTCGMPFRFYPDWEF